MIFSLNDHHTLVIFTLNGHRNLHTTTIFTLGRSITLYDVLNLMITCADRDLLTRVASWFGPKTR
jgi:hypothetical protein